MEDWYGDPRNYDPNVHDPSSVPHAWGDPLTPEPPPGETGTGMEWMFNPNQHPVYDPGPGYYWSWNGSQWEPREMPRAQPNTQQPNTPAPPPQTNLSGPVGPTFGGGGDFGGSSTPWPSYSMPSFDPGPAFSYRDFAAPTSQDVLGDQGFQFRMDQGRKALESSAAGRGVLRSGGTLKDILNYGQNFASQEYGNVYDRALKEYDTNRRNAWDTWSTGYTGRKDKYGFDQNNAQFGFNATQRQAEFDRDDVFKRWAQEGDWLTQLAGYGLGD